MLKRLKRWYAEHQTIKRLIPEVRRQCQLLQLSPEDLTDREITILAMNLGLSLLVGQCMAQGVLAPNAVCGRVVEVPLYKTPLH